MKKLALVILLSICVNATAQRQNVTIGKDGELIVNGDTVAYIEKEGCKMLKPFCKFFITDGNNSVLVAATMRSFNDSEHPTPEFPEGLRVTYLVFSFQGVGATAEVDILGVSITEESVAKIVAQWRLVNDKKLDVDAVEQFISHYGTRYSERERRQNQAPTINIIQDW